MKVALAAPATRRQLEHKTRPQPGARPSRPAVPWVDAAPFRAHLQHVMAAGELDVPAAAVLTGVSSQSLRTLLYGRGGRPVRRISPETAGRLFLVTSLDARRLAVRMVAATAARASVQRLRTGGRSDDQIARALVVPLGTVESLASGAVTRCSQLVTLRAVGAAREVGQGLPAVADVGHVGDVAA